MDIRYLPMHKMPQLSFVNSMQLAERCEFVNVNVCTPFQL